MCPSINHFKFKSFFVYENNDFQFTMRLKILNCCVKERFSRFVRALPAVIIRTERWHLPPVSLSYHCSASAYPDHRFFSSAITETSCNAVENVPTDLRICGTSRSNAMENNPLLFQNTDLSHFKENWKLLLENCARHLASLSNDQLEILLRNILSVRSKINYDDLLKFTIAIDRELVQRAPSWTIEQSLVYFELLTDLPKPRRNDFVHHLLKHKQHKIFRYDLNIVTKFVRLMNKYDTWGVFHVLKYDYEIYFKNNLTSLTVSDLEVFLEFMVRISLVMNTPNLFQEFCDFVLKMLPELSSSGIINFCKILHLRRNVGFDRVFIDSVVEQLIQCLRKRENFHADAYIAVASLCREQSLVDVQFYPKFSCKFTHQLDDLTPDRIAEGMKYLTHFDDKSEYSAVYDRVVNHLRSKSFDELSQHPEHFIQTMFYLSRVGIYPAHLIDLLFSSKFLAQAYPKGLTRYPLREYHVIGQELLTIDGGVEIEFPDYQGNRLDADVRHLIQRYYCWKMPKLLSRDLEGVNFEELLKFSRSSTRFLYFTRLALERVLGGANFVHTGYLLPHLPRPNLLFALSKDGKPAPLTSSICKMIVNLRALDSNLEWYTFGVYSFGDRASGNKNNLLAEEIPKVRQLKKRGFKVLKLIHNEWSEKSEIDIEENLRKRIYSDFKTDLKE